MKNKTNYQAIIIVGSSGSGKGYLNDLLELHGEYKNAPSHTTRMPKPHEKDGQHYFFPTMEDFQTLDRAGHFIETNKFGDHYYGLSEESIFNVINENKTPLITVDHNGAKELLTWGVYDYRKQVSGIEMIFFILDIPKNERFDNIYNENINLGKTSAEATKITNDRIDRNGDNISANISDLLRSIESHNEDAITKIKTLIIKSKDELSFIVEKINEHSGLNSNYSVEDLNGFLEELRGGQTYMEFGNL